MKKESYSLQHDGIEMVEYSPILHREVKNAAECWQRFLELPVDYLRLFMSEDTQSGVGIEIKDGSGPNADRKINFDYAHIGDRFDKILNTVPDNTATAFIKSARVLESGIRDMSIKFAKNHSLPVDNLIPYLRFLYYPHGTKSGNLIAEPHTDHSGFTFHLYESTSGCERLSLAGEWKPIPVADGQAVAFGGMQSQYVSAGEIKALCHKVTANTVSQHAGRIAIVCFVSFTDIPMYNKRQYGRLQEMSPGFNYALDNEEFSIFFSE